MSYTRQQWIVGFLNALGNSNPTQNTVNWVSAWSSSEFSPGLSQGQVAQNNLLAVASGFAPYGGTPYSTNSAGVMAYPSFTAGVDSAAAFLKTFGYSNLVSALSTNNESALGFGTGTPSTGVANDLCRWSGGGSYTGGSGCASGSGYNGSSFVSNAGEGLTSVYSWGNAISGLSAITASTNNTNNTNNSGIGSQILSALGLPSAASVQTFIDQFALVFFGALIILIGILILFFSSDAGKQTTKTAAKVAMM